MLWLLITETAIPLHSVPMFAGCHLISVRCHSSKSTVHSVTVANRVGSDALGLVPTSFTRSHASDMIILVVHVLSTIDINSVEVESRKLLLTGHDPASTYDELDDPRGPYAGLCYRRCSETDPAFDSHWLHHLATAIDRVSEPGVCCTVNGR